MSKPAAKVGQPTFKKGGDSQEISFGQSRKDGTRETIESIAFAFILAFLFRAFEAEAFVIPTGSMAPTLLGQHKDVTCEKCGTTFTIGASDEMDNDVYKPGFRIKTALCPNCRHEMAVRDLASFKGDRILVNKFPYEFTDPDRWDVVVFRYPDQPNTNYIKRLVGLPGEILKIERGDVYARKGETGRFHILRKDDLSKQLVLQQIVYDDDHPARELHRAGWPERWTPVRKQPSPEDVDGWSEDDTGWQADRDERSFHLPLDRAQAENLHWLRYRHFVPSRADWEAAQQARPFDRRPQPQLITDFCGYNMYTGGHGGSIGQDIYWVGDLTVTAQVEISETNPDGQLLFELNEGVRKYRSRFDINTGAVTLSYIDSQLDRGGEEENELATAQTALQGPGTYKVIFANVDNRLALWVGKHNGLWMDTDLVEFGSDAEFQSPALPTPTDGDLIPVGIAARGADVRVSHLLLQRDIYYRSERVTRFEDTSEHPNTTEEYNSPDGADRLHGLLSDPARWYAEYEDHMEPVIFPQLASDEFFMMGDNSPRSRDSRVWSNVRNAENRHAVPRTALIGKAFFIYWPHGVPFLNNGRGFALFHHKSGPHAENDYPRFSIPFYPQINRMHRIR